MKINNSLKEKIIRSKKCTKYKFNDRVFDTLNEENAYWLGFLYADGNIAKESNALTFTLAKKDLETVQQFKKFMGANNPIFLRTNKIKKINKIYESYEFRINSVYLKHKLKELGIVPNKGAKIKYPKFISKLDLDGPFIRGYFDGDGNLTKYYSKNGKSRISIGFSSNKDFLNGITTVIENKLNILKPQFNSGKPWKYIQNVNPYFGTINYNSISAIISICDFMISNCGYYMERKIGEVYKWYYKEYLPHKIYFRKKFNPDINTELKQGFENGTLSIFEASKKFKTSTLTLKKFINNQNIEYNFSRSKLNKEDQLDICNLYNLGKPSTEIAKLYSFTPSSILKILRTNNIVIRNNYKNYNNIVFNGKTNKSLKEWAKELNTTKDALRARIKRYGIEKAFNMVPNQFGPRALTKEQVYYIKTATDKSPKDLEIELGTKYNTVNNIRLGKRYKEYYPELTWKSIEDKRNYPSKLTKYNLNGKFVTIKEVVGLIGITERQIRKKLQEGFTVEKIVEYYKNYIPQSKVNKGMKNEKLEYDGINLTFEQWSEITGLSIISINNRVKKGWTGYQVLLCPKSMRLEAFNSVADNLKMWLFIAWLLGHPKGKLLFGYSTNTLDKFIEMLKFFQRHNIIW